MKMLQGKLTYANVISTLCLFLLLGGGAAFAATQLPKNSVGPKQLKKNAVTTSKIKNGAVTGAKVKLSTLGTVPSARHASSADTAANAQTLGGLSAAQISAAGKLQCPSGTVQVAGLCFEATARAASNYVSAVSTCGQLGRILPSVTELATFDEQTAETSPTPEWAGQLYFDGAQLFAEIVSGNKKVGLTTASAVEIIDSHSYRCAVPPSN